MNDVIYRQDAIDALAYFTEQSSTGRTAQNVIQELPPAQPEREEGEWIEIPDDIFAPIVVCSKCGQTAMVSYGEYQRTRYCPYCGIPMREGGEE